MKKQIVLFMLLLFASSLTRQFLLPTRSGTVISNCADVVSAVATLQAGEIPQHLFETGKKQGDEFDVNQYFKVLTHLSMQEGYKLDYVYQSDSLGGYPILYARPVDQAPYTSTAGIPENTQLPDFRQHLDVEDV